MPTKINNKFSMFQEVYLITDWEQLKRMVTQIHILPGDSLSYMLSCNGDFSEHYEEEITTERQII